MLVAGAAWHVAYTGFDVGRGSLDDFTSDWVFNLSLLAGVAAVFVHTARKGSNRYVPALLGIMVALWVAANVYWTIALKHAENAPYPSLADAGWLLSYVPAYVALVLIIRRRAISFLPSVWLDGVGAALVVAALSSAFVITPIAQAAEGSTAAIATNLAYPLGDLLLVLLVLGAVALGGWTLDRQLVLLGTGFVVFAIADTGYLYRVATGSYEVGTVLDSAWLVALAIVLAAAFVTDGPPRAFRYEGWAVLVAPFAFVMAATAVLVYGGIERIPRVALAFAAAALLTVFLRAGLTFRDIRALAEVRREALTDVLTDLPNRRWLYKELATLIERRHEHGPVALVMIDLDGFKELNDTLGHQTGDRVLEQVARRFVEALDGLGTPARLGGDEFAFLCDEDVAEVCAERIQDALATGFPVDGFTLKLGASAGVAVFPRHASDAESLLRRADIAMYEAKRKQVPWAYYSAEFDRFSRDRLAIMSELRDALATDALTLVYQPKIALPSGEVAGVEALARWHDGARGEIAPSEFVPIAERAGLVRELTHTVLASALDQCAAWHSSGIELPVSVNITAADLLDGGFDARLAQLLDQAGVPPRLLCLEITEHGLMGDPDGALEVTRRMADLGVRIALDDFGTGYSSLAYLSRLPVDELKIDRSFVTEMSGKAGEIVRCAAQLGRGLGLTVVAEGVESGDVLGRLLEYGCHAVQGYYFAPPLPLGELEEWLAERARRPLSPELRVVGL